METVMQIAVTSSSVVVWPVLVDLSHHEASGARLFIIVWWRTPNLKAVKSRGQCLRLSVKSMTFRVPLNPSLSVQTVIRYSPKEGWSKNTAHTTARSPQWTVQYAFSLSINEIDKCDVWLVCTVSLLSKENKSNLIIKSVRIYCICSLQKWKMRHVGFTSLSFNLSKSACPRLSARQRSPLEFHKAFYSTIWQH